LAKGFSLKQDETPEERRARKHAVKEARQQRRVEKKATSSAFAAEKARQETARLGSKLNPNGRRM
jgi:hypothetical protein